MEKQRRLSKVEDGRRLLRILMQELAGDAHISFAGELREFKLLSLPAVSDYRPKPSGEIRFGPSRFLQFLLMRSGASQAIVRNRRNGPNVQIAPQLVIPAHDSERMRL